MQACACSPKRVTLRGLHDPSPMAARPSLRKLRWFALGFTILVLTLAAAPFLVPLSGFIPQITKLASAQLGRPVAIAELRLSLWPTPRAAGKGIRIGASNDIVVEDVRIVPDVLSLLGDSPVIREIRLRKISVKESALALGADWGKKNEPKTEKPLTPTGGLRVERVVLEDVTVEHSTLRLRPFDLELALGPGFGVRHALFVVRDGSFLLALTPRGPNETALDLSAKNWLLPVSGVRLRFDSLAAQGVLYDGRLAFKPIDAVLYDGRVAGEADLDWRTPWRLRAALDIKGVDVAKLQRALNRPAKLSGHLSAQAKLSAKALTARALADHLVLDAPFRVDQGTLGGMDLTKVGSVTGGKIPVGGETRFEQFTGKLKVRGRVRRVNDFCARSSALVAGGYVQVSAKERLSGKLDVAIANTAGLLKVPVKLSGTTSNPVATPSRTLSLGAIVGTLLLPGVGTALGASAGNLLEGSAGCR